jgi:hypothetical protein
MAELDWLGRKNRATRTARSIRTFFVQNHPSLGATDASAASKDFAMELGKEIVWLESPFPRLARKSGESNRRRPASSREWSGVPNPEGERYAVGSSVAEGTPICPGGWTILRHGGCVSSPASPTSSRESPRGGMTSENVG